MIFIKKKTVREIVVIIIVIIYLRLVEPHNCLILNISHHLSATLWEHGATNREHRCDTLGTYLRQIGNKFSAPATNREHHAFRRRQIGNFFDALLIFSLHFSHLSTVPCRQQTATGVRKWFSVASASVTSSASCTLRRQKGNVFASVRISFLRQKGSIQMFLYNAATVAQ